MKNKYQGIYPFNERGAIGYVTGTEIFRIHQKAMAGKKLTREEKDYAEDRIQNNTYFKDGVALMGMKLDFSTVLKRFWVQTKYGEIREYFAFDKTSIRNYRFIEPIRKIVEIK